MKKILKELLPAFIISFVMGFMLLIYEPINMYATNINDFWFDFYIMIKPSISLFIIFFVTMFTGLTIVYLIESYFYDKKYVYKTLVILAIIAFIGLYIQGNYLIGNLPSLDGSTIDWSLYKTDGIISIFVFFVPLIAITICTLKLSYEKTIKVYCFIVLAVFVMLSTSLVSIIMKPDALKEKEGMTFSTTKYINQVSANGKNYYILVLDAVDSQLFEKALESSQYSDLLKDFTYYPDTLSGYGFTRDSIPFILSGVWNENEMQFRDYYNKALNESKFLNKLIEEDYDMNIYEGEFMWSTGNVKYVNNAVGALKDVNFVSFTKQLLKYILFKYLPYQLKPLSSIDTMQWDLCKVPEEDAEPFKWLNTWYFFDEIAGKELEKIDNNYFSFTHIEGAHPAFCTDENLNVIDAVVAEDLEHREEAYRKKCVGLMKIMKYMFDRLKYFDSYDNSVIVVMSDHGYNYEDVLGRQNPILYIKGINEEHDKMQTSDKAVSYADLQDMFIDLLNDKKSDELLEGVDPNRTRRFLNNLYMQEEHMTEYELAGGKAWNWDDLKKTGRSFDLKEE